MTQSADLGAIANIPRGQFRDRVDQSMKAVATWNSGSGEPPLLYPHLRWIDTDTNLIYVRDGMNTVSVIDGTVAPFSWVSAAFVINVKQFGAVGDGSVDDTAAITAAIAAMPASGGRLYFPTGIYKVSSTIALNKPGVYFGDCAATVIRTAHASADVFDVTTLSVVIEDLSFAASVTRTGGAYVKASASDFRLQRFRMVGANVGVHIPAGLSILTVADGSITDCVPTTGMGVLVEGGLDASIRRVVVDSAAYIAAGIWVTNSGDVTIEDCVLRKGSYGLIAIPDAGKAVASLWANNTIFEDAGISAVSLFANGGAIVRAIFDQSTFSSAVGFGLHLRTAGGGLVSGVDVNGCRAVQNGGDGVNIADGGVHEVRINGGAYAQNILSGIGVANGVNDFSILGVRSGPTDGLGPNAHGVYVSGPSNSNYTIAYNDLHGNATSNFVDNGTGTKQVAGNF